MKTRSGMAALLATLMLATVITGSPQALAAGTKIAVDNSNSNGATTGSIKRSSGTTATIAIRNTHTYWTSVVATNPGGTVTIKPGPGIGGVYAALGIAGPDQEAVWEARFDTEVSVQSFVVTPFIFAGGNGRKDQFHSDGLPQALTILQIFVNMLPSGAAKQTLRLSNVEKTAEAFRKLSTILDLVEIEQQLKESKLDAVGRKLYESLSDPLKAKVIREILAEFGVKASLEETAKWTSIDNLYRLVATVSDMAWALISGTSSGVVAFSRTDEKAPPTQPKTTVTQPKTAVTQPKTTVTQPKTTVTQPQVTIPSAPTSLSAEAICPSTFRLTWTDNANNETGFRIYDRVPGTIEGRAESSGTGQASWTKDWGTFLGGSQHRYSVTAYNSAGESVRSNEVYLSKNCEAANEPPAAPSNVTASAGSGGDVSHFVYWKDNSDNEDYFEIDNHCPSGYSGCPPGRTLEGRAGKNDTDYGFTGRYGEYHCFRVRAVNAFGASNWAGQGCAGTEDTAG